MHLIHSFKSKDTTKSEFTIMEFSYNFMDTL